MTNRHLFYKIEQIMDQLSRIEEIILLAVLQLGADAYGVTIRNRLEELTGRSHSVGAIYIPLDRLAARGFLSVRQGNPTRERGGRRKRYYRVTPDGLQALRAAKRQHDAIWEQTHLPEGV